MRLLNIHTLEFETFLLEESRPPYVITSHRWADDEITFQQFLAHKSDPSVCQTAGFRKVKSFCHFVKGWRASLDLDWIWIDTCCIGIYLPLIYGEREQAFERLEEAIERRTQRKATQMPKIITSQSPNSTRATWGDRSEIDSNDDEDSGAITWHQIAKKHNHHGNKLLKSGQYAAAVEEYTNAIHMYRESPTFLMNRASAYMMMTRYGEAINDCNSALDLDPRNPEITELIAEAKNALGLPPGSTPLTLDSQEHRMNALDSENEHVSSKPTRAERPRVPRNSRYHTSPGEASEGSTREPQKPATKSSRKHERESMHRPGWGYHDILPQREPYSAPPQADGLRSSRYSGGFSDPNDIFADFMRRGCSDDEDIFARYSQGEKDQKGNADPSPSPTVSKRVITEKPLPVSLEDILNGTTKKLKIRRKTYDPRIGKQGPRTLLSPCPSNLAS
ncbi:hypothetical protein CBER1_10452 [Cercospora berteroae]|uniref:Uncharacterized protein n=1 Tax=Cercospora berteroae TaxID=357750 RepID=A0A2S6CGH7_9PEZI|nr:hypothetical protein CBER1_10452 [Cercospora berteroae]